MSNFERVKEFMTIFGQEVKNKPGFPDTETQMLRFNLIEEEVDELEEAFSKDDLVGIADALTDILYVVYGAGHAYGIDLDKCFAEVHRSNMSKLDENGNVIRRADGKVLKSDRYTPPDLYTVLGISK